MDLLYDNILEFKILNYNDQCKYVINKLLSIKSYDITHTVFYKTLFIILSKLAKKLKESNHKIGDKDNCFFNFWSDFEDFLDVRGFIKLDYVKLSNDKYLVRIPTNFSITVYLNTDISDIQIMISNAYHDYINNILSYIHFLPFDEQIRKCNTFLDNFINNQDQIFANKKQYKIF